MMYIDADMVIKAVTLFSALGTFVGAVIAVYKVFANNKKQNEVILKMQKEQRLICEALKGALEGLIENGCDGPCKDALAKLNDHLNETAHQPEL